MTFVEQQGRQKWSYVSAILAQIHNSHVTRKQDLRDADKFNPYKYRDAEIARRRFRAENPGEGESLAHFIKRNQGKL